ncbi:MAG: aminoacyl-tRNA hydrolase [Candidatus Levybacteria bacterium RIFCSPLOWO2_01_FULL_36_13]|nr:MAG: aminoacyl-tRNA hydrolase [Candidatus Levybacteria bacterium RIFCSPHIGHO2_01_FULL_36_15b]OGH34076.1 MAG: aminoacyl-tRNA hydrolase [Candidatus Levybacteria bacterium RIFCSPLOWO2_01_FULL_36_13]
MKLIVGLGNPGEKYEKTKHNLGFVILDHLVKDSQSVSRIKWDKNAKLKSEIFIMDWQPKKGNTEKIIFAKPQTYMNKSGLSVSLLANFYKITPSDIWIIHDELDLPLGSMKIRLGGSAAGHHGVESIISILKTDKFWRFRLGIGQSKQHEKIAKHNFKNATDYVLEIFTGKETSTVKHLIKRATQALSTALEKDIQAAMNQFNTK